MTVPTLNEGISFQVDDASFVDGVDAAITEARKVAGDQDVNGFPYFAKLDRGHLLLDDPIVLQGRRALHLRYPVKA